MRGRMDRLDAAALVNRYIDDYGARLHQLQVIPPDEFRRLGPRDEYRSDHEISCFDLLENVVPVGVDQDAVGGHDVGQIAETLQREVEDSDLGAHAGRHFRRVDADDPAAEDHDRSEEHTS